MANFRLLCLPNYIHQCKFNTCIAAQQITLILAKTISHSVSSTSTPHCAADAVRVFSALVNTDVTQLATHNHACTLKTIILYIVKFLIDHKFCQYPDINTCHPTCVVLVNYITLLVYMAIDF